MFITEFNDCVKAEKFVEYMNWRGFDFYNKDIDVYSRVKFSEDSAILADIKIYINCFKWAWNEALNCQSIH